MLQSTLKMLAFYLNGGLDQGLEIPPDELDSWLRSGTAATEVDRFFKHNGRVPMLGDDDLKLLDDYFVKNVDNGNPADGLDVQRNGLCILLGITISGLS